MSYSPERISAYRRYFEGAPLQVGISSASPARRSNQGHSGSYKRNAAVVSRAGSSAIMTMSAARKLDEASAENQAFLNTRTTEKQEMITLNDRLTKYIEKVRYLETQNKLLETEVDALQNRFTNPSGVRMLYEERLREMRRVADQMMTQRDLAVAAKDAMGAQVEILKAKYQEALEARKKAEVEIEAFRPDLDAATAGRIALEKQLDNLEHKREFLQRVHKQEIEELMAQIYSTLAKGDAFGLPDLGSALKNIQAQYSSMASKNLQEMDGWYKTKFQDMSQKSMRHMESVRSAREEIRGLKTEMQSKERELDSWRTRNEVLEAKLRDATERYRKEEETLQARVETFKQELSAIKTKITVILKEYQDLLNVKMSLEMEITTYRKLIVGEDNRLNTMVSCLSLMGSASTMAAVAAVESASSVSASAVSATEKSASVVSELTAETNDESNAVSEVTNDESNGVSEVTIDESNGVSEVTIDESNGVTEVTIDESNGVSEVTNDESNGVSEVANGVNGDSESMISSCSVSSMEISSTVEMESKIVVKTIPSPFSEEQAVEVM